MERRIVLARSTKGMTEVAANSGALAPDLFELLAQIDGQSTSEELCVRLDGLHRGRTATRIAALRQAGYLTDHESTLVHRPAETVRADASSDARVALPSAPPTKSANIPGGRSIDRSVPRGTTSHSMDKKAAVAVSSRAGLDARSKPLALGAMLRWMTRRSCSAPTRAFAPPLDWNAALTRMRSAF